MRTRKHCDRQSRGILCPATLFIALFAFMGTHSFVRWSAACACVNNCVYVPVFVPLWARPHMICLGVCRAGSVLP